MTIQVAQTLYDTVDAALKSVLTGGTANVMIGIGGLIGTFWLLSFTMRSMQWLWMGMTAIYKDVLFEILKMAVIASMAFNVGWYIDTIVPFVTGLPVWMGGVLSGQEGNQLNQVDSLISAYVDGLDKLTSAMSFDIFDSKISDIYLGLQAVVIYLVGGLPFILVAVGTTITLKVATMIMLALGPVFIAFLLFDQTRQYFMGWLSTVAGFMLTQVMFALVLAFEVKFINTNVIKNGQIDTTLAGNISMLVYFLTFAVLATELPNYAASVMGGASSGGVTGLGGILGRATGLRTAGKMAKAAGSFGARILANRLGNKMGAG